jgi:hypothetical protein
MDGAGNTSTPVTTSFVIDLTPPTLVASPSGGTFTSAQSITLQATDASPTTIFYTLDGATPSEASTLYSGPIAVNQSLTLSSVARDAAGNMSAARSDVYTIALPVVATATPVPVVAAPAPEPAVLTPPAPAPAPAANAGGGGGGGGGGGAKRAAAGGGGGGGDAGGALGGVSLAPAGIVPFVAPGAGDRSSLLLPASSPLQPTEVQPMQESGIAVPEVSLVSSPLAPASGTAESATLALDPALGGSLSTPDGSLTVVVPPGAYADALTLSLSHVIEASQP